MQCGFTAILFPAGDFTTGDGGGILPAGALASVSLPPQLFQGLGRDPLGVFFTLYTEATLFPIRLPRRMENDSTTLRSEVSSPIVGATVGPGIVLDNLNPPVVINLRLNVTSNVSKTQSLPSTIRCNLRIKDTAILSLVRR